MDAVPWLVDTPVWSLIADREFPLRARRQMSKSNRDELISRYREGPAVLADAVARLSERQLDHKPADGGFSAREGVHHTADSEMTSAIRLRPLVAEHHPQITGYDPE